MCDTKEYLVSIPELQIYHFFLKRRAKYFREKAKESVPPKGGIQKMEVKKNGRNKRKRTSENQSGG